MRSLCAEPLLYRPWEVGRLTPFQVKEILFAERDKQGSVILDPPVGDEPEELTMAGEWRKEWLKRGITDPDALRMLTEKSLAGELPFFVPPDDDEGGD